MPQVCAEEDHASWRNIAARLSSPQSQSLFADGPGTESTIRLPVFDFGHEPPPSSPAETANHRSDGRKRTQKEQMELRHREHQSKRFKAETTEKSGLSRRDRSPMGEIAQNQAVQHRAGGSSRLV